MKVADLFSLAGRVAFVTGGARGLGLQIAEAYAGAGARLVLASRGGDSCREAAERFRAGGADAIGLALDLRNPDAIAAAVREATAHYGRIDVLVNNGGTSFGTSAEEMPLEAWRKVLDTNLTGAFLMSQAVMPAMRRSGGGSIVNIASVAGLRGQPPEILDAVGYSASKGGLVALTRDLAVKWARHNIRVNAIAPGFFPTRMTRVLLERVGEAIVDRVPLGRLGGPEDLMGAALFFAAPASAYVTGQVLAVDGGSTAQ